jgi:hypothetical protein
MWYELWSLVFIPKRFFECRGAFMNSIIEETQSSVTSAGKQAVVARKNYKVTTFFFNNKIRSQGSCGPGCDRSGFKQYLVNTDDQNRYRVTVVSTWINSQTGAQESYTKIYTSEASGEIYLGCDFQHITGNGDTRVARKITREVRIEN